MMKHLRIYPLIFAIMASAILGCMLRIGYLIYDARENRVHAGAQFVQEVTSLAQI